MMRKAGMYFAAAFLTVQPALGQDSSDGSYLRAADFRVARVVYRLATAGAAHCPASHPWTGLVLHQLGEYEPSDRPEAVRRFAVDQGPGIVAVVPGSPAARAGLKAGDVILSANSAPFPPPAAIASEPDSKKRRDLMEQVEAQLEEQLKRGPVRLRMLRDGKTADATLDSVKGCAARGRLARSAQANAFADGRYAIMTTKMLDFLRNDDELAVAMAHEMAHNILRHPARLEQQNVPGGILRNIGKNAARVLATEEEADRLGITLAWAAGYDISAAIPFWRRLYATYDPIPVPKFLRTHPSLSGREKMIGEVLAQLGAFAPATN